MVIHSMKLAQALPGETSLILFTQQQDKRGKAYEIKMSERGYFEVTDKKSNEMFMVFAPNIAWIRCVRETEVEKKKPGRPAKGE